MDGKSTSVLFAKILQCNCTPQNDFERCLKVQCYIYVWNIPTSVFYISYEDFSIGAGRELRKFIAFLSLYSPLNPHHFQ